MKNKMRNKPCECGSGLKTKKCLPNHKDGVKMVEGELVQMKSVQNHRKHLNSTNRVVVRTKVGHFCTSNVFELEKTEFTPKELQKIVDDYCVKFSWNYKGSLQFQKEPIGDGVELTREEIVNKVLGVEFDLWRWMNDFDYYMKFFHENKSVNHIITYGFKEISNELTDELEEFSKSGKKGKEMEKLDWMWDNYSSFKGYDENTGEKLKFSDEEVQEVWDLNYEEITTGWRYPHKFDQHKTVKEVFMTKDYQDKSEKYLQSEVN